MLLKNKFLLKYRLINFATILSSLIFVSCATKTINRNILEKNDGAVERQVLQVEKTIYYTIKPGEVSFIKINDVKHDEWSVICEKKKTPFSYTNNSLLLIIRESYFSKRKKFNCVIKNKMGEVSHRLMFQVIKKIYPHEQLNVNKRRVVFSKKDLAWHFKEKKMLTSLYERANTKIHFSKSFMAPLKSKITSIYGTRRIFNNMKKTQHLGTDFRAKIGTPIPSSNAGVIMFSGDLFFTGGTVIINHGLEIYSVYGHLSKLLVKAGDVVSRGKIVALSGVSGRVTGPHLHWGVKISGTYINSSSLINQSQVMNLEIRDE